MPKFWSFLGGLVAAVCVGAIAAHAQRLPSAPDVRDAVNGFESTVPHRFQGVPTDWADRYLVFSEPSPGSRAAEQVQANPRYWLSKIRRSVQANSAPVRIDRGGVGRFANRRGKKSRLTGDWSQSLGTGGKVGAEMFPAKYTFSPILGPDCTNDFVVFNTNLAGSATQASVAAFNNLYTTTCSSGTVPGVYWAYNTGGTARTSVTLSTDGTQVAFVESVGTTATLVLLKWKQSPTTHSFTATTSSGSANLTAGTFVAGDVGAQISAATGIPAGTTIIAVTGATTATMSATATASGARTVTVNAEAVALPGVAPTVTNGNYRSCTAPCMTQIAFSGSPNDTNSAPFPDYSSNDVIYVGADNGTLHKFTGVFSGTPAEAGSPWPVTVHSAMVLSSPVYDAGSSRIFVGDASGLASYVTAAGVLGGTTQQIGAASSVIVDAPLVDSSTGKVFWFASRAVTTGASRLTDYVEQTDTDLANSVLLTLANNSTSTPNPTGYSHAGAFDNLYLNSAPSQGFLYFCAVLSGSRNHPTLYRVGFTNTPTVGTLASTVPTNNLDLVSGSGTGAQECSPITEFLNGTTDRMFVSVTATGGLTPCTGACLYSFAPATRTVTNAVTNGTTTVTSATANFVAGDVGSAVTGTNIPVGATISTRVNSTTITISAAATGSASGGTLNIVAFPTDATAGIAATGGTSGIIIDNSSSSTGASEVYFSPLGGGNGAVQASQSGLN